MNGGINQAEGFVHVTAQWQVVNRFALHDTLRVDNECAAQGKGSVLVKKIEALGDGTVFITEQGIADTADAPFFNGGIPPCSVRLCVVNGNTQNLGISLFELAKAMVESDEFAWSDECEVFRIKEKHNMLSLVVRKADFLDGPITHHCGGGKIRGRFIYEDRHYFCCLLR